MSTATKPKKLCAADDPNWLPLRMHGISASEAAAACGVSEYQTPLELYLRKRGELPPIEENRAMRRGKFLEPFIAREFELESGITIAEQQPGLFSHAEIPWILATPDAVIDEETGLELKDMDPFVADKKLGADWSDEVPYEWLLQAQQQMAVMGWYVVHFAVMVNRDLRCFTVERNETVLATLLARESSLWSRIQNGHPPALEDHATSLRLVREMFGHVEEGQVIKLSEENAAAWARYEAKTQQIKELEQDRDRIKARCLFEMGSAEKALLPDGRCLKRSVVKRKGYTVEPCEFITLAARKM